MSSRARTSWWWPSARRCRCPMSWLGTADGREHPIIAARAGVGRRPERRVGAALVAHETEPAGKIHSVGWPVISVMRSKSWS